MTITIIAILSGILQIDGYYLYFKKIFSGHIKPNTATWSIWAFGAILDALSYLLVTNDILKSIVPIVCAFCAIFIFVACIFKGKFDRIDAFDRYIICFDVVVSIFWYLSGSPVLANFLLVLSSIFSFIPIIRLVWRNPFAENATPWYVWTAAYSLMTIVVFFRWEKWEDLFYPISFLVLHFLVGVLSVDKFIKRKYVIKTDDFEKTAIGSI